MPASKKPGPEVELQPKLQAKMMVSSFLAGFTFNALMLILANHDMPSIHTVVQLLTGGPTDEKALDSFLALIGVLCLTAALALFLSVVYMYDHLLMPRRFWDSRERRKLNLKRLPRNLRDAAASHGEVYVHMVAVWNRFFTPAVAFAGIGFTVMMLNENSLLLMVIFAVIMGAVLFAYFHYLPDLSHTPE
jgi:hypothetical protein